VGCVRYYEIHFAVKATTVLDTAPPAGAPPSGSESRDARNGRRRRATLKTPANNLAQYSARAPL